MLLGLDDFDVDIFLRFEDENIYVYYSDFESIPELANYLPLGSFDDEGKFQLINLPKETRIEVGTLFLERDLFIEHSIVDGSLQLRLDRFYEDFKNIPEVVAFCEKYYNRCKDPCESWCDSVNSQPPNYEFPDYAEEDEQCFAKKVPWDIMPEDDKYYVIVVYFNGIYRTSPEEAQNFGVYNVLTDVNFELNTYSLITDIKEFFTREFIYFLKTPPGSLPFANDYGTHIKTVIQTKNLTVQRILVENEINFFIIHFNELYGDLVTIKTINIVSQETNIGADSWLVEVYADVKRERLIYRLEI